MTYVDYVILWFLGLLGNFVFDFIFSHVYVLENWYYVLLYSIINFINHYRLNIYQVSSDVFYCHFFFEQKKDQFVLFSFRKETMTKNVSWNLVFSHLFLVTGLSNEKNIRFETQKFKINMIFFFQKGLKEELQELSDPPKELNLLKLMVKLRTKLFFN